ncbi:VG15 protein [Streptomonospora wellingtoniae]|uniref:Capsid maturation protease n=1 Tax=Streptomonospora wellingtoniae TaxID=3075544 RepID=A0ABU2L0K7_9ACTN|nr:hypothetical protein [Streptomonospora sp. DSM 45055]MDT0305073.1 hypothetical protein [Streptomonospora sp. DSM 45055]
MTVAQAREHRADQVDLAHGAARRAREVFREGLDPADIRGSWRATLPQILGLTTAAQYAAARLGDDYLDQVIPGETLARLAPGALSGVASDGRDLPTLLTQPVITALAYLAGGRAVADALGAAATALEMIVGTQVTDAGRVADLVGLTGRPAGVAYTRVVTLPACARCILLAGQTYSWSEGFQRHPRCDCVTLPLRSGEQPPGMIDPRELFDAMTAEEQDRRFGAAAAAAIRDGADIGQVVNARRGMSVAGGRVATTEGTTRRGYAARRMGGGDFVRQAGQRYARSTQARLMPEQIIADADGDRQAAIDGLIRYGYLAPVVSARSSPVQPDVPAPEPPAALAPAALPDPPAMSDTDLETEIGELLAAGDVESPRMAALVAELDRRDQPADPPAPAATVDRGVTADDLMYVTDDRLATMLGDAWADDRAADAAVIEAELERRAALADAPPAEAEVPDDETDEQQQRREREEEQYTEIERLVEQEGYPWEQAVAEVQGRTVEEIRRQEYVREYRPPGDRRSFRDVAREQYKLDVARRVDQAEEATRGYLLTNEGRRQGVDPVSLFSGPRARAERWASEELKRWWDENGRFTFEEYVTSIEQGRMSGPGRDYNR